MIEILTVFASLNLVPFNNSLHFDICKIKANASYIYLETNNFLYGVVENSTFKHYNFTLKELCLDNLSQLSTSFSTPPTRELQHSIIPFKSHDFSIQNLTYDVTRESEKCNLYHYAFLFVSLVTFLVGLVLKPDAIYESLKRNIQEQRYTGNNFSKI